jgi:hypothetical protein
MNSLSNKQEKDYFNIGLSAVKNINQDQFINLFGDFIKPGTSEITEEEKLIRTINLMKKCDAFVGNRSNIDPNIKTNICVTKIPPPLKNNFVNVGKSNIHGYGVFATKNIEKDKIITYYPAHAVCFEKELIDKGEKEVIFANQNFQPDAKYKFNISENYSLIGDKKQTENSLLLGHMVNDADQLKIDQNILSEIQITAREKRNV